jgi:hypothetical protein
MPCVVADAGAPRVPDDDGFTVAEGDCDDFAVTVNPGAYDIPGNGIDEDCQGGDATTDACDQGLAIDASDPMVAARAIELCAASDETARTWGVISARWTTPDGKGKPGSALMHGILPSFGKAFTPIAGASFLALSSGVARSPGQAGFTEDCSDEFPEVKTDFPGGESAQSPSCPDDAVASSVGDAIALELRVRMPTNVTALRFDSTFFTEEYPDYICTPFNDFFQVVVKPVRMGASTNGNVLFDLDGNSVSVNNSLLRACKAGSHGGKTFDCPLGMEPLEGTGYETCNPNTLVTGGFLGALFGGNARSKNYGAATGWLTTEFSVLPGEIVTLLFTIWDSEDHFLDSLSLIDHVHFRLRTEPPPPEIPVTEPLLPD